MKILLITLLCLIPYTLGITLPRENGLNSRIIGGFDANIRAYPFVVAVNVQTSLSRFFCGGTLYGSEWVITAGQCVDGATLFTVSLGSATLNDDDPNRVTVATSTYYLHPEYNPQTLENDIGIIQFRIPITHTDYIKSVNFLPSENIALGIQYYAFGWGQISDSDSSLSNKLKVAYIGSITNEECRLYYGSQITDNMVCIVGNYNEGICHGDTGGPLITTLRTGTTVLIGVASFMSSNGCESTDPSGFTRTYPYVDWIANVTNIYTNTSAVNF
ncbi:brachyurin-like [Zophobas morio]|uniref:brachyurin-like n=1 Tax=Zophobas morio TaxID=2755281 RepID=UPI0030835F13